MTQISADFLSRGRVQLSATANAALIFICVNRRHLRIKTAASPPAQAYPISL
jgi:hypothetical protein